MVIHRIRVYGNNEPEVEKNHQLELTTIIGLLRDAGVSTAMPRINHLTTKTYRLKERVSGDVRQLSIDGRSEEELVSKRDEAFGKLLGIRGREELFRRLEDYDSSETFEEWYDLTDEQAEVIGVSSDVVRLY